MTELNQIFRGALPKDAEVKNFNGTSFIEFSLGYSKSKKNADGKWENGDTQWLQFVSYDQKIIDKAKTLTKGTTIAVYSRTIDLKAYTDKQGQPKATVSYNVRDLEIVFRKKEGDFNTVNTTSSMPTSQPIPPQPNQVNIVDQDLPF